MQFSAPTLPQSIKPIPTECSSEQHLSTTEQQQPAARLLNAHLFKSVFFKKEEKRIQKLFYLPRSDSQLGETDGGLG